MPAGLHELVLNCCPSALHHVRENGAVVRLFQFFCIHEDLYCKEYGAGVTAVVGGSHSSRQSLDRGHAKPIG